MIPPTTLLHYKLPDDERLALGEAGAAVTRLDGELRQAQARRAELVRESLARHRGGYGATSAIAHAAALSNAGVQKIRTGNWR